MRIFLADNRGFSLVWLAAVLAAAGLILAAILPGGKLGSDAAKHAVTVQHMQAIEEATRAFMAANLRRPCPSDATLAQSAGNFGIEAASPGVCTGGTPAANYSTTSTSVSSRVAVGGVPTKTLGLPDEDALDGYNRRIMYFVDTSATSPSTCHDLQSHNLSGGLNIIDAAGNSTALDYTMWALLSYGKDGHGAFPEQGGTTRFDAHNTNADMQINALETGGVLTSIAFANQLVQHEPVVNGSTGFDDLVWYLSNTKNTCALGKAANNGFHITGKNAGAASVTGMAVATGDVNGDGFADLVIGMPSANANGGVVYVVFGSALGWPQGGLPTPTPFALNAIIGQSAPITGISQASGAVVTSTLNPANGSTVYINGIGGMTQVNNACFLAAGSGGSSFTLQDMNGNNINSTSYGLFSNPSSTATAMKGCGAAFVNTLVTTNLSFFGEKLAVGDINNDGFDDIVVGGKSSTGPMQYTVILGASNLHSTAVNLFTLPQAFFIKTATTTDAGDIAIGDFNGDGIKDILVSDKPDHGYVIYGSATNAWSSCSCWINPIMDLTNSGFNSTYGFGIYDSSGVHHFGNALAGGVAAGDLNGDLIDDLVLTDNTYSAVYVVWGKAFANADFTSSCSPAPCKLDLNTSLASSALSTNFFLPGAGLLGNTVTVADINGDGIKDIVMSGNNGIWGYYGHTNATSAWFASANITGVYSFYIDTSTNRPAFIGGTFPQTLTVGDVNGDGITDLLLGDASTSPGTSQGYGATRTNAGSVYVILQPNGGFLSSSYTMFGASLGTNNFWFNSTSGGPNSGDATYGFRIDGLANSGSNYEYAYMPVVMDINRDGKNDIVIGAPGDGLTATPLSGAYVIYGRKTVPWDPVIDLTNLQ